MDNGPINPRINDNFSQKVVDNKDDSLEDSKKTVKYRNKRAGYGSFTQGAIPRRKLRDSFLPEKTPQFLDRKISKSDSVDQSVKSQPVQDTESATHRQTVDQGSDVESVNNRARKAAPEGVLDRGKQAGDAVHKASLLDNASPKESPRLRSASVDDGYFSDEGEILKEEVSRSEEISQLKSARSEIDALVEKVSSQLDGYTQQKRKLDSKKEFYNKMTMGIPGKRYVFLKNDLEATEKKFEEKKKEVDDALQEFRDKSSDLGKLLTVLGKGKDESKLLFEMSRLEVVKSKVDEFIKSNDVEASGLSKELISVQKDMRTVCDKTEKLIAEYQRNEEIALAKRGELSKNLREKPFGNFDRIKKDIKVARVTRGKLFDDMLANSRMLSAMVIKAGENDQHLEFLLEDVDKSMAMMDAVKGVAQSRTDAIRGSMQRAGDLSKEFQQLSKQVDKQLNDRQDKHLDRSNKKPK